MIWHTQWRRRVTVITTCLAACTFQFIVPAFCARAGAIAPTSAQQEADIEALENRFFETTYKSDSEDERLGRLEQMVFGEMKQGSDNSRLEGLMSALKMSNVQSYAPANQNLTNATDSPTASGSFNQPMQQAYAPANQNQGGASQQVSPAAPGTVPNIDDYPRITALEQQLLGTTHRDWDIHKRLDALETKAFGKESTKDLTDRVASLETYARRHGVGPRRSEPDEDYSQAASAPQPGEPIVSTPMQAKVAWLESEIFGASNPYDSMADRVRRLDGSVFPADRSVSAEPLPENVNTLVNAVEFNKGLPQTIATPAGAYYQPSSGQTYNNYSYTPNQYPPQSPYGGNYQTAQAPQDEENWQNNNPQAPKKRGHSLLHGLAHVAGSLGGLAMDGVGYGGFGVPFLGW